MLTLSKATAADIPELLKLMAQYYEYDGHPFDAAKAERGLGELVGNASLGELWLISLQDVAAPIGYFAIGFGFSLECGGREAFIDELFVLEEFRGQGIGAQAVEHAIERCRINGVRALRLETTDQNAGALRLYKRLGFVDLGRHLLTRWIESDCGRQ